jgi:uncharacterized protein YhaN
LQERTQLSATLEEERARSSSEVARLTQQAQAAQQQAGQLQAQVRLLNDPQYSSTEQGSTMAVVGCMDGCACLLFVGRSNYKHAG